MDHVVHINNGSGAARPIVLRLLPGEETIFNLKVVNHGEPSNISLQASSPVFKAVRLKKPDHYVVQEEVIPVLARMPANKKRLEGEILVSGGGGESRVPITLLRDSEDPGDDWEDPGLQGDEELKDDLMGEALERVDASDEGEEEEEEEENEDDGLAARRRQVGGREYDDEEGDEEGDEDDSEKEPRRIAFSRDKDLQRYRSATRQRRVAGAGERGEVKQDRERARISPDKDRGDGRGDEYRSSGHNQDSSDDGLSSAARNRFSTRIDDRFVDPSHRQEESPRFIPRQVAREVREEPENRQTSPSGYEEDYQDLRQDPDSERRTMPVFDESEERDQETVREEYIEPEEGPLPSALLDKLGGFRGMGTLQVVPAALFLALVTVLIMTFITESIPEFPGALGSSILIVTLIIYGAATLLKA